MTEQRKPGRPKKLELVGMKTVHKLIRDALLKKGVSPDEVDEHMPAQGTIYNKKLKNYGKGNKGLYDKDEVLEKLCS